MTRWLYGLMNTRWLGPLAAATLLATATTGFAATPVHKCVVNGSVMFQRDPCPSGKPRPPVDLERLNAEEKKRREAAAAARGSEPLVPTGGAALAPPPAAAKTGALPAAATPVYRCDGRTHCSQMTSCAEARYFLANCPNVKMDGNRDGVPCQEQWCGNR